MASPVSFLQDLLSQAQESASGFAKRRLLTPILRKKQQMLDRLDELKVTGEELSQKAHTANLAHARLQMMQQRAGLAAEAGTGQELNGPPNPDPVADAQERASVATPNVDPTQIGAEPGEETLATQAAGAARIREMEKRTEKALGLSMTSARIKNEERLASGEQPVRYVNPSPEARAQVEQTLGRKLPTGRIPEDEWRGWEQQTNTTLGAKERGKNRTAPTVVIQTVDADGNPTTKIVPKVAGAEYTKAAPSAVANRVASGRTVLSVSKRIVQQLQDPELRAQLGQIGGSITDIKGLLKYRTSKINKLRTSLESYALGNMGVHAMRNAQEAHAFVARNFANRFTPESIEAGLEGMNAFAEDFVADPLNNPRSHEGGGGGDDLTPEEAAVLKKYERK